MVITYRYRLLPTKRQHAALGEILEQQRQLYNAALQERIDAHRKQGILRTYIDQTKALTEWRRSDSEARGVPVALQRATLKRLDAAYRAFFRRVKAKRPPGHPRFRGKGWFNSFGFCQASGIGIEGGRVRFMGMPGALRIHVHRPLPSIALVRTYTFKRDVKGWFIGLSVEVAAAPLRAVHRTVGVDLGISNFVALSDGGFIPSLRAARRNERQLRLAQRALSRCRVGSRGRLKARRAVTRSHAKVARKRADHLHQASARLVRDYDLIAVEDLDVGALARSILAKDVCDASWSTLISMVRYKAERAGARLAEVDPRNTSQQCSTCGFLVPKRLSERQHCCMKCGLSIDRDLNAARNILRRVGVAPGLRNVAECGMRASGNLGP